METFAAPLVSTPRRDTMKLFIHKDEVYIRAIPGKNLFHSTMVHEVVNRGDIFAVRVRDSVLTIIPGTSEVEHCAGEFVIELQDVKLL